MLRMKTINQSNAADKKPLSPLGQLTEAFCRDVERVIATLEPIHDNKYRRSDDVHTYLISVHAMKSALANVGETELAALAGALEEAGSNGDTSVMLDKTPVFLDALRAAIEKLTPEIDDAGSESEDKNRTYLRENLLAIQAACAVYDKKAAKDALAALQQKAWTRSTKEQLDAIAVNLLHSDFEEAAAVAGELL